MIRSLYLTIIYGMLLVSGVATPFASALGYVWVDTFTPQYLVYSILTEIPVSALMAGAAGLTYVFADFKSPPRPYLLLVMMVAMGLWCCFTTYNDPVAPAAALAKFNYAGKNILFCVFMPFVFRSRIQIEALILVFLFSVSAQFIPFGLKTLIGGGGYGMSLGLISFNAGLGEGSFLAATCAMCIPLMANMQRFSVILPRWRVLVPMFPAMIILAIATSFGTFERTALFGVGIVLAGLWWRSKRRVLMAVIGAIGLSLFMAHASTSWLDRMSTVRTYKTENSANERLLIWAWTLEFAETHPLGGGFNSYYVNEIQLPGEGVESNRIDHGRAFHSIYFEYLGEHGWPGLILFLAMIGVTISTLRRVAKWAEGDPEFAWLRDLALCLLISCAAVFVCGAFIGIGFQPVVWYLFSLTVMLQHHTVMCEAAGRRLAKAPSPDRVLDLDIAWPPQGISVT